MWKINFIKNFIKNLSYFLRFSHETAASCLVGDSWERAAHVKVDFLITHHLALVGETYYLVGVVAKYLRCQSVDIVEVDVDFFASQASAVIFVDSSEERSVELIYSTEIFLEKVAIDSIGDALKRS